MTTEIPVFFNRYAELYMDGDAEAVADMCEAPFLAVRRGRAIHLPDREAVVGHLAGNMAAYQSAGATSAEIAALDVLEQGAAAALVTVRWHVRAMGGATVRELTTSYQLLTADPMRILAYVNHDRVLDADT